MVCGDWGKRDDPDSTYAGSVRILRKGSEEHARHVWKASPSAALCESTRDQAVTLEETGSL